MNATYTVLLKDGTTGTMKANSISDHDIKNFIGEVVRISAKDENGMPFEAEGELVEVLETSSY